MADNGTFALSNQGPAEGVRARGYIIPERRDERKRSEILRSQALFHKIRLVAVAIVIENLSCRCPYARIVYAAFSIPL